MSRQALPDAFAFSRRAYPQVDQRVGVVDLSHFQAGRVVALPAFEQEQPSLIERVTHRLSALIRQPEAAFYLCGVLCGAGLFGAVQVLVG